MGPKGKLEGILSSWSKKDGPHGDVVLGSRIRLARNVRDVPFPLGASPTVLKGVLQRAKESLAALKTLGDFRYLSMGDEEPLERELLVEKHLMSPQHLENPSVKALLLKAEEDVGIMINEEDHFRIQVLLPGLQLESAFDQADAVDDLIGQTTEFAFCQERGYLTACPTNVGTGMRASCMVHLPALTLVHKLDAMFESLLQVGITVRGIYGEGSGGFGGVYQISNQATLGHAEEEVIEHLLRLVKQVIHSETYAREFLFHPERRLMVEDKVFRSLGTLLHARLMDTEEAMSLLSDVRLGVELGLIKQWDRTIFKQLMLLIRGAHLQRIMGQELNPEERDTMRASLIQQQLNDLREGD